MTREMLQVVVLDLQTSEGMRAHWEGDDFVVTDISDEDWVDNALIHVEIVESDRPRERIRPNRRGLYELASFSFVGNYSWTWSEIVPPWPGDNVDARTILELLSADSPDGWPIVHRIKVRADIREIASALNSTRDASLREQLCYLIGRREQGDSAVAIPALLALLDDADKVVRGEAAAAIVRIPSQEGLEAVLAVAPTAGEIVLSALAKERYPFACAMLAGTLGELRHAPATGQLIALLDHEDAFVRQKAARSLGRLRASEAEPTLRRMLESETNVRATEAIREALAAINSARDAEV